MAKPKFGGWRNKRLDALAEKAGVINPVCYLFTADPPQYWVLDGDNIDTTDIGSVFKEAEENMKRGIDWFGASLQIQKA